MLSLIRTFKFMFEHPIGRRKPVSLFNRWVRWQIGSRILGLPVICPFIHQTRLVVESGMHGATMNLYTGLQDFHDMSFVAHTLREGDLFVDIGANVGVYTILGGAVGAHVISIEPIPKTFEMLMDNIRINNFGEKVTAHNIGIASKPGTLTFSTHDGPKNRVVKTSDGDRSKDRTVDCLDSLLSGKRTPLIIKIDVEGYEYEVLKGAKKILSQPNLFAVILELNGLGLNYGFKDENTDAEIRSLGFAPAKYDPFKRKLIMKEECNKSGNTLYVRKNDRLLNRLIEARKFTIMGISL